MPEGREEDRMCTCICARGLLYEHTFKLPYDAGYVDSGNVFMNVCMCADVH